MNLNLLSEDKNLLRINKANEWMSQASQRPIPKMLFSEFWFEGEISILFADTNIGKSILAVQIADSISSGNLIPGFKLETTKQKVMYFDFEMSDKQFQKRYSFEYERNYHFDEGLLRIEINSDCTDFNDFETRLFESISESINKFNSKVLIIDNLTYLKMQSTETAKEALPLMKKLKELKIKHNLSILVLAHTPKRSPYNPITINDLAGSKHLSNFADSIFAIGLSQIDKSTRYIKQLKSRATEIIYGSDNVIVCHLRKEYNFLGFEFEGFSYESVHLKEKSKEENESLNEDIIALKTANPNLSLGEIAEQLGTYKVKVGRVLKNHGF